MEVAMNKKIKTDAVDHLFQAVLCLQTQEECYDFFEDLCTVNELLSLSQRFEVASMLKQHKNVSGNSGKNRRINRHHQPRQPFPELRQRRLSNCF